MAITYPPEMLPRSEDGADVLIETDSGLMTAVPKAELDALIDQARYICEAPMGAIKVHDIDKLRRLGKAFDAARRTAGKN